MKVNDYPFPIQVHPEILCNKDMGARALGLWLFFIGMPGATNEMAMDRFSITQRTLRSLWDEIEEAGYGNAGNQVVYHRKVGTRVVVPHFTKIYHHTCEREDDALRPKSLGENGNHPGTKILEKESPGKNLPITRIIVVVSKYYDDEKIIRVAQNKRYKSLQKATSTDLKRTFHLSHLFLTKQQGHWPNFIKEVSIEKVFDGALEIYRLMKLDHYEYTEVKTALKWLAENPDNFWSRQILSLRNLRKKFSDEITKFDHIRMARDRALDRTNVPKKAGHEDPISEYTERKALELSALLKELTGGEEDTNFIANRIYEYYKSLPREVQRRFKPEGAYLGFFDRYMEYIKSRYGNWDGLSVNMLSPPDSLCWTKFIDRIQKKYRISFKTGRSK